MEPNVNGPSSVLLARLTSEQRDLLAKLFSEPVEYIDHPAFGDGDCEGRLFADGWNVIACAAKSKKAAPEKATLNDDPTSAGVSLSAADERLLFERFNYARFRIYQILEAAGGKSMRMAGLRKLIFWAERASKLRSLLTQINMPLVLAMAKRIRLNGVDFAELISEGNMALLRSVDKFDCSRGFKFSTYACRAILKSFSRVAMRTTRYRSRFPAEFDPNLERSDYLDRVRENRRESCVEDLQQILSDNLARLNDIEQTVIRERFSLDAPLPEGTKPKTLEEIGNIIGVTKERVRQIQNKALAKLRNTLEDEFLAA